MEKLFSYITCTQPRYSNGNCCTARALIVLPERGNGECIDGILLWISLFRLSLNRV